MSKINILLGDSSDSEVDLKINKSYANNYGTWRNKEELQKLKILSKDVSESSSSSEEEPEPEIEEDFLKTLSLIKSKDPKIYDTNVSFFKEQFAEKKSKEHKPKPMFMKDYERTIVLERNGEFSDEDKGPNKRVIYGEEQDKIKQSFKALLDNSDDEDDLLQARQKTEEEKSAEEADYLCWLKGQEKEVSKNTEKEMSFLRSFWNDPTLDDSEKFLKDFILNKKYLIKGNESEIPTYDEITGDIKMLQEDEQILKDQQIFEHKYNFRFEEPDEEFIKRYPRTVRETLRRVDSKRKVKREEYAERKKREKEQKREELKRLKALKRKQILDKFMKLKEICGKDEINLDENDFESDFDPDKHDQKMKELFNEDYYKVEEKGKPQFSYDEELDDENWNKWCRENAIKVEEDCTDQAENRFDNMPISHDNEDAREEFENEMIECTQNRKKERKKSLFAKIVSEPKPLYDPDGKSFQEYLDEYYKLDYEDLIGDLPVRYKYRKVVPNSFGLSVDEILFADDKELNKWCSVRKTCQYRNEKEEIHDVKAFERKALNEFSKKKIFQSLYAEKDENTVAKSGSGTISENASTSKKKRKSKRKKKGDGTENVTQNDGIVDRMSKENNLVEDHVIEQKIMSDESTVVKSESGTISESANTSKKKRKSKQENKGDETENVTRNDGIEDRMSKENNLFENHVIKQELMSTSKSITQSKRNDISVVKEENTETNGTERPISESSVLNTPKKKTKKRKRNQTDSLELTETEGIEHVFPSKHKRVEIGINKVKENAINIKSDVAEATDSQAKSCSMTGALNPDQTANSSTPTERKRKKRKRRKSDSRTQMDKNSFPHQKSKLKNKISDKRLLMSNARLAAYGINPKQFKNRIIYSQK